MLSELKKKKSSDAFKALYIIILLSVILIGAYSAVTAYLDYNSEKVRVDGTVTSSEVERDSSRRGVSYDPDIEYEYSYNGQTYSNDNVKPGAGSISMSRSEAESLVSNYSEGDVVTVYIDAESPSTSWLVNELPIGTIVTSSLISIAGLFILYKNHLKDVLLNKSILP